MKFEYLSDGINDGPEAYAVYSTMQLYSHTHTYTSNENVSLEKMFVTHLVILWTMAFIFLQQQMSFGVPLKCRFHLPFAVAVDMSWAHHVSSGCAFMFRHFTTSFIRFEMHYSRCGRVPGRVAGGDSNSVESRTQLGISLSLKNDFHHGKKIPKNYDWI